MTYTDAVLFFREWLRSPRGVAALTPSGRALARLITREISPRMGPVLELGPGTGAFTQALIERGMREQDLTLIEYGVDFARLLEARFPQARVLRMDAAQIVACSLYEGTPVGAIVCGLGFLNMPEKTVETIVRGAFSYLQPGGAFYLFTYGSRCSVPDAVLDWLDLNAALIGRTFRNIPPASVYKLTRRH